MSALRNCLFAKKFAEMQAKLQAQKIEEYAKKQAFLAAQKTDNTFNAMRRSSAVRAAAGIASDAGSTALDGASKAGDALVSGAAGAVFDQKIHSTELLF